MNDNATRICSCIRNPFRILLTITILGLGCWTVYYTWPLRLIRYDLYTFSADEGNRLNNYPKARYAYGMNAWLNMQPEKAASFFREAVTLDNLNWDAWHKLAEVEAELGNRDKAKEILSFAAVTTENVFRWKWPQLVLAESFGMEGIFHEHVDYLLNKQLLVQDTFQLLYTQMGRSASAVIDVLNPAHLPAYLNWLMLWGLPREGEQVWDAMVAQERPDTEVALRYAHFLLGHKRTIASKEIWSDYTGEEGLANAGFESEITGRGFDWRFWRNQEDHWSMKRVSYQPHEGNFSLKVAFKGQANLDFQHLYQIFAVSPKTRYKLSYFWKSRGLTTDQGPFIEIFGYDKKGLYQAGSMITGSRGWHENAITFESPADCHAAVMRLRRRASMRFDSKIRGMVWLDKFRLDEIETPTTDN